MRSAAYPTAVAVWCVVFLAGCSATVGGAASPSGAIQPPPPAQAPPAQAPPRLAPAVRTPLDARGFKVCDLLTPSQLAELSLDPTTAESKTVGISDNCTWKYTNDPGNVGGVQLSTHPTLPALDGIYLVRDTFAIFEPLEISGHPAVHADRNAGSGCSIYTGIADYQAIAILADSIGRPRIDACAPSRRMAEMILSNLPPLR